MKSTPIERKNRQNFIRVLVVIALVLFCLLIQDYIVSLILAVIFASLLSPIYGWFQKLFKGKKTIASIATIICFVLVIVIPSYFLLLEIVEQAIYVSKQLFPFIEKQVGNASTENYVLPDWLSMGGRFEPYREAIFEKISQLAGNITDAVLNGLGNLTQSTLSFFLNLFVMFYGMYFFLVAGKTTLGKFQNYLPLTKTEFNELTQQILSISRATLKGALLIGIVQGFLVGIGFWVVGIPGAVFWGTVAAVISIIPSLGTSLVYVPAGIYLLAIGEVGSGIGLLIWGFGVVSTVDNFLRPQLIGRDTQMPDLLILVTTLGGLSMFGIAGIVLGPLIAGVFISLARIYRNSILTES